MLSPLKFRSKLLSVALIFLFVASCKQTKSPLAAYGTIFEQVIVKDQGIFRGFTLGDSLAVITKTETNKPLEQDKDYLYYEYKIDSNTTFNIKYSFDEKGELNEIESDIFVLNNTDLVENTFIKFKKYFDEHYGESETKGGFNVWTVKSEKYGDVMIDLSNEFPAFNDKNDIAKISLWIYPDKY